MVSLAIAKGDCIIKGFVTFQCHYGIKISMPKDGIKIYLSPSNATMASMYEGFYKQILYTIMTRIINKSMLASNVIISETNIIKKQMDLHL